MKTAGLKLIVGALLLVAALTACGIYPDPQTSVSGSGKVIAEARTVGGFDGVTITGIGSIVIDQNGSESLTITTDDNLLQYITTEVRGGKLVIQFAPRLRFNNIHELTFKIGAKNLSSVQVDGAATVQGNHIATESLSVILKGAGNITLSGKATEQNVVLDGVGLYNGAELTSQRARVKHSGTGGAVVRVSDTLDVTMSGLGGIEYIGNPQVTKQISGMGAVRQRP